MDLIELKEVANIYMRMTGGKRKPSLAAVYRWTKKGLRGVRLRVEVIGGKTFTSEQHLREFDRELTAKRNGPSGTSSATTDVQKTSAHNRAVERLRRRSSIDHPT